jgi:hypothetical protein
MEPIDLLGGYGTMMTITITKKPTPTLVDGAVGFLLLFRNNHNSPL